MGPGEIGSEGTAMRVFRMTVSVLTLAACASLAPPSPAKGMRRAAYLDAARAPAPHFCFVYPTGGDRLGDDRVVIRAWPHQLWLRSLQRGCDELDSADGFGVTSSFRCVPATRDQVVFRAAGRGSACRMRTIQPIDRARLRVAANGRTMIPLRDRGY